MVVQLDKWSGRKADEWEHRLSTWEEKFSARLQKLEADRGRLQISEELCSEMEDLRCQLVILEDDCSIRELRLQELECDLRIEQQRLQYAANKGAAKRASTNDFGERVAEYFTQLEKRLGLEIEIYSPHEDATTDEFERSDNTQDDPLKNLELSYVCVSFRLQKPTQHHHSSTILASPTDPNRGGRTHATVTGRNNVSKSVADPSGHSHSQKEHLFRITLRLSASSNTDSPGPAVEVVRVQPELHADFLSSLVRAVNTGNMTIAKFIVAIRKAFLMRYVNPGVSDDSKTG